MCCPPFMLRQAVRVLLGRMPLTATAYPLRVQHERRRRFSREVEDGARTEGLRLPTSGGICGAPAPLLPALTYVLYLGSLTKLRALELGCSPSAGFVWLMPSLSANSFSRPEITEKQYLISSMVPFDSGLGFPAAGVTSLTMLLSVLCIWLRMRCSFFNSSVIMVNVMRSAKIAGRDFTKIEAV